MKKPMRSLLFLLVLMFSAVLTGCETGESSKLLPSQSETAFLSRTTEPPETTENQTQAVRPSTEEPESITTEVPDAAIVTTKPSVETTVATFPVTSTEVTTEATEETQERILPSLGEETVSETAEGEKQVNYIANKNTKKFHYPNCSSVKDMKEENKLAFTGTREELIQQGYQPCKRCNP